jgi:hypothetical protein
MSDTFSIPIPKTGDPREILDRISQGITSLIANIEGEGSDSQRVDFICQASTFLVELASSIGVTFPGGADEGTRVIAMRMTGELVMKLKAIEIARKRDAAVNN